MASNVSLVPFGKYKGQPVEALAQDSEYCEWLAGQDWFRTRYTAIHTLIVNNFAAPHETPEHNALQVLFTDTSWVTKFIQAYLGQAWWLNLLKRDIAEMHDVCSESIENMDRRIKIFASRPQAAWETEQTAQHRAEIERIQAKYQARHAWLTSGLVPSVGISHIQFEQKGADVEIFCNVGIQQKNCPDDVCFDVNGRWFRNPIASHLIIRVECKPVLGDDYPAVLRQMIAHGSEALLIGRGGYQGIGATYEQVKKIFSASRIKVVLLADIDGISTT